MIDINSLCHNLWDVKSKVKEFIINGSDGVGHHMAIMKNDEGD